ncbi:MAG: disulfide bond formation protein B [Pseudomonadota bacterium]
MATKSLETLWTVSEPGENALVVAASASLLLLAGAHAFETFAGMAPCPLCLDQREVHWAAVAFAGIGWIVNRINPSPLARIATISVGSLIYVTGFVIASYHAGVEYGLWPGPASCASGAGAAPSAEDVMKALSGAAKSVPCDEAPWRFLGISMAGYNALISGAIAAFLARNAIDLRRGREPRMP